MTKVRLVCLVAGQRKDGGTWYKATLKKYNSQGMPHTADFYLPETVGANAVKEGLVDDVEIMVELDFDDFFRPSITSIAKAKSTSSVSSNATGN